MEFQMVKKLLDLVKVERILEDRDHELKVESFANRINEESPLIPLL